ncbi:MAG TPA: IS630 family transposase [Gemmataceae bacterium]|nr:IS630 family transposase [Gemmataceae bacterium]
MLEARRCLAVQRALEGYSTHDIADFLGVDARSVRRWLATCRQQGTTGLAAQPASGRPPKLSPAQERIVRRWLADRPTAYGFATELWSAPRLAQLIEQEWGISLHPDSLTRWLRQRGFTPPKPRRGHRERDAEAIARWRAQDWPRIKKRPFGAAPRLCCWTKADC